MRLIDADKLLPEIGTCELELKDKVKIADMIRQQPTEDGSKEAGKWKQHKSRTIIWLDNALEQFDATGELHRRILTYQCSECRMIVGIDSSCPPYRFCPHCGRKMEGEEE